MACHEEKVQEAGAHEVQTSYELWEAARKLGGQLLIKAHLAGINTQNDYADMKRYLKMQRDVQERINLELLKKKKFMESEGKSLENWHHELISARNAGFKSNDPFKDISNYWQAVDDLMDNPVKLVFYKDKIRLWMEQNVEVFENALQKIGGIQQIAANTCSIYCWLVKGKPYYIGQSKEMLLRLVDHIYCMFNFPEYWLHVVDHLDENVLFVSLLEKCEPRHLNEAELKWIQILKPLAQKCDGSDHIIPIHERNVKSLDDIVDDNI